MISILCDCCERPLKRDELQRLEIGESKVDFCGACTKLARAAVDALIAAAQAKRAEEREAARETLRAHRRATEAAADRARTAEADAAAARAELEALRATLEAAAPAPAPAPGPDDVAAPGELDWSSVPFAAVDEAPPAPEPEQ